jgi:hypothetical protein
MLNHPKQLDKIITEVHQQILNSVYYDVDAQIWNSLWSLSERNQVWMDLCDEVKELLNKKKKE